MAWPHVLNSLYQTDRPIVTGEYGEDSEPVITPLDEVKPYLVGKARTKVMHERAKELGLECLTQYTENLLEEAEQQFLFKDVPRRMRFGRGVNTRYRAHIEALAACGILQRCDRADVEFLSGYFAVPKTDQHSRAVFNGKRLSRLCRLPATVNLMDLRTMIRQFCEQANGRQPFHVVMGDFRHWFHQIAAAKGMSRLFGIKLGNQFYRWTTVPMGWSWSPIFAQATAWSFLTYRKTNEEPLLDERAFASERQLPQCVRTPGGGFVSVYYDNFIIVTPDKNEAVKWKQRITNNSDELHVVIKDGTFEHLDPERIERDGFTYLGVAFRYQCHKDRRGRWKMHSLEWKAAKQDEWRTKWQEAKPRTFRDMAIWIGRCVFISMLNKEPVQLQNEGRQLIAHAREMGRIVGNRWDEDAPNGIVEDGSATIQAMLDRPAEKQASGKRSLSREGVLTTDSSGKGYGWTFHEMNEGQRSFGHQANGLQWAYKWSEKEEQRTIFAKELEASLRALRWAKARGQRPRYLVMDNSAAAFTLRNGFTNSEYGQKLLGEYEDVLADLPEVVLVVSKDNPSDCASRGTGEDYTERCVRLEHAINVHMEGGRYASESSIYERDQTVGSHRHLAEQEKGPWETAREAARDSIDEDIEEEQQLYTE